MTSLSTPLDLDTSEYCPGRKSAEKFIFIYVLTCQCRVIFKSLVKQY